MNASGCRNSYLFERCQGPWVNREGTRRHRGFRSINPDAGDEIKGTGGARKIRFGGTGKGKSGGLRIITFYGGADIPVFLLNVFAKNEKTDLTKAERNEFKATLAALAKTYRERK